jgi:plastocyanin
MLKNNLIAVIAISFTVVGTMWAVRNFIASNNEISKSAIGGILLIAKDNLFNSTNPDIHATVGNSTRVTIINKDFVRHDFIVDGLKINTGYLASDQDFTTAIATTHPGIFEYYCSLHPETMRGKVVIER